MENEAYPTRFLDQVRLGQTEWYRYFFGIILILFFWFVLGSLFVVVPLVWVMIDGNPETAVNVETGLITGVDAMINYVALNLSFGMLIVGLFLTVRFVHGRPFRSLVTPAKRLNWRRLWQGFGLWLLLVTLASVVEYLLNPDIYTVVFDARRFFPFAVVVLLLTPMFYLSIGAFFAFITLRDNSAELAIGAHAANNLYSALFANYTNSALQTESIFLVTELDAVYALASFWAMAILFYLVLLRRGEKPDAALGSVTDG